MAALVMACMLMPVAFCAESPQLSFDRESQRFTAEIQEQGLIEVLGKMTATTGWDIFVEPDSNPTITTSFTALPVGQALRILLGNMNYALLRDTNAPTRLYVFYTSRANATRRVESAADAPAAAVVIRRVGNELIVTVKPGTDIEALAASLGAKVTGRLGDSNTYRLEFEDREAADAAKEKLASSSQVASVDYNYYIERPTPPQSGPQGPLPPVDLALKPPPADGKVVIGLVDTAVQPLGGGLDGFLLAGKSVAGQSSLSSTEPSHGTSMAETILRSIQSASPDGSAVRILPVDIYGADGNATSFDVAMGIALAVNEGANLINMSLGSYGGAAYLEEVIRNASEKGVAFFGAAGNEPVTNPVYPAAYADVIAVTAAQGNQLASYANRGSFVDMAAPGSSTIYYNGQPYVIHGTSAATAWASGLAGAMADSKGLPAAKASQALAERFAVSFGSPK